MTYDMNALPGRSIDESKILDFEEKIAALLSQRRQIHPNSLGMQESYIFEIMQRYLFVKHCISEGEFTRASIEINQVKNLTSFVTTSITIDSCNQLLEKIEQLKSKALA